MMKNFTALFLSATLLMGCMPATDSAELVSVESNSSIVIIPQSSSYTSGIETTETIIAEVQTTSSFEETVETSGAIVSKAAAISETALSEATFSEEFLISSISTYQLLDVENIQQMPELPAGCEITSTTIALNYVLGTSVDKIDMISYMPCMPEPIDGVWDSPMNVFIGSPFSTKYGAYAPVICTTINNFLVENNFTDVTVTNLTGSELSSLYSFIDNGTPVIIWGTLEMREPEVGKTWLCQDGSSFTWTRNEHCMVLIGYDTVADTVFISDPWDPRGTVEIDRALFENRYNSLFQQAVVIEKRG